MQISIPRRGLFKSLAAIPAVAVSLRAKSGAAASQSVRADGFMVIEHEHDLENQPIGKYFVRSSSRIADCSYSIILNAMICNAPVAIFAHVQDEAFYSGSRQRSDGKWVTASECLDQERLTPHLKKFMDYLRLSYWGHGSIQAYSPIFDASASEEEVYEWVRTYTFTPSPPKRINH